MAMPTALSWSEARGRSIVDAGASLAHKAACQGRQGPLQAVVAAAAIAFVAQDILAGRARRQAPVDVKASLQTLQEDAPLDWERWRGTVPRTCAPTFTYLVPAGPALRASEAQKYCAPLLDETGYVGLTPELMRYNADTLTLDGWSGPACGLQFGDQLAGIMFSSGSDLRPDAWLTYEALGGNATASEKTAWFRSNAVKRGGFEGSWRGINQSGELSMKIHIADNYVELGNGQQLAIVSHNDTHVVSQARDGTLATGRLVGDDDYGVEQLLWDICESDCELERMPEYYGASTGLRQRAPEVVALGNATKRTTWWQERDSETVDFEDMGSRLLFTIDSSTSDQDLDNTIAKRLQEYSVARHIPLDRMHVDITKLWIRDQTLQFESYYAYSPPWQVLGADPRELYFPLEVYGSWERHESWAHDWSGLEAALAEHAARGGYVSFLVHSVGAEPCFFAPPEEDHVSRVDEQQVQLRAFTSHYARMVTKDVSGRPLQGVDSTIQEKTWSLWSSAGYNGDIWLGDANYADHSHSSIEINFKVYGGQMKPEATLQSCDATTQECGEASTATVVTDTWMGMEASSVRISVVELLNRSKIELSNCVDRCSIDVELAFENRLWRSWMASPLKVLSKSWKGEVSLAIRVSRGNSFSSIKETGVVSAGNRSMIHTREHGGAMIRILVTGDFGYADFGYFLAHVGALSGVLVFGLMVVDHLASRMRPKVPLTYDIELEGVDLERRLGTGFQDEDQHCKTPSRSSRSSRSSPIKSIDGDEARTPLTDSTCCDSDAFEPPPI